ncbi:thiopeptide-type bacteriocin biosynthesis protein [Streptomyces sp. NPDC001568]|uniref:thiopeptide-type bacteriocin biosynthesis protein n=1 Tax=Streptomyces sp. NPDC001568 TaxID=3364588 RepID=UPI00368065AB
MDESPWVSAHIFHQGDTDQLILGVLGPLTARLRDTGLSDADFFLRYWEGGPHVRLRVSVPAVENRGPVRTAISTACDAWFRDHPSVPYLDQEQYTRQAGVLAAREGMTAHATRLYPNDSVRFIPYRREYRRYGTGEHMAAVERHFAESSGIALSLLEAGAGPEERQTAAYCMLLIAWFTAVESDPTRVEAEGPGNWAEWIRPEFEGHFDRRRATLISLLRSMRQLALRVGDLPEAGNLARWAHSVRRLAGSAPDRARVLDACAHLLCNRLGVQLDQEGYVRHLAARAMTATAETPGPEGE